MAGARAELDASGLSLWLVDRKDYPGPWRGGNLLAVVGGLVAARLGFAVHPDGQAVSVVELKTYPGYGRRGLASALMDALYLAHPTAWINHGYRTGKGVRWWNQYTDPAPERNIHNRPPSEWATYFDATTVGRHKARNAFLNEVRGVDGHRDAEYRYGERSEREAERRAPAFRPAWAPPGLDPAAQDLYAGVRLLLRPGLRRWLLDSSVSVSQRAQALLGHVGHGNLPHHHPAVWNSTARAAFEDVAQVEVRQDGPPGLPALHVVFKILPLSHDTVPSHDARPGYVKFTGSADVPVQLAGMSWRPSNQPWAQHAAAFEPAVDAALEPMFPSAASPSYRARYDARGHLRPEPSTADRIADVANKLIHDSAARMASAPPPPCTGTPGARRGRLRPTAPPPEPPRPGSSPRPGG